MDRDKEGGEVFVWGAYPQVLALGRHQIVVKDFISVNRNQSTPSSDIRDFAFFVFERT